MTAASRRSAARRRAAAATERRIDAVAATTRLGQKGLRDESLTADGRLLYALDADAQQIFGWQVVDDGALIPVGAVNGLPATAAGLAAL